MVEGEAAIPLAHPLGLLPGEVAHVLDRVAEAGRADEGAVAAGQAALGDLVPARVLHVPVEQLLDPVGVELAAHLGRALLGDRGRGGLVGLLRLLGADLGQHLLPALRARLDQEAMLAIEQLGQGQVEPGLRSRPGVHRDAEAGVARLRAVDRDDEGVAAAGLVVGVGVGVADEDLVLHGDRRQVAGAHPEEGVARALVGLLLVGDRAVLGAAAPSRASGWAGRDGASRSSGRC